MPNPTSQSHEVSRAPRPRPKSTEDGGRTRTPLRVPDFESGASASSATSAERKEEGGRRKRKERRCAGEGGRRVEGAKGSTDICESASDQSRWRGHRSERQKEARHRGDESAMACKRKFRRCPTLPQGFPCSTIGSEELNYRVRDGIGCGLFEIATGERWAEALRILVIRGVGSGPTKRAA